MEEARRSQNFFLPKKLKRVKINELRIKKQDY